MCLRLPRCVVALCCARQGCCGLVRAVGACDNASTKAPRYPYKPPCTKLLTCKVTQVTAVLVMYGLPRLLTGSILAHECMHAWFVLNYIDCASKAVNEGLSQLMALMWIEAQHNQVSPSPCDCSYIAQLEYSKLYAMHQCSPSGRLQCTLECPVVLIELC